MNLLLVLKNTMNFIRIITDPFGVRQRREKAIEILIKNLRRESEKIDQAILNQDYSQVDRSLKTIQKL